MNDLFDRAEALGVSVVGQLVTAAAATDDLEKLLEAVHVREGELMLLRHAIERRITSIFNERLP